MSTQLGFKVLLFVMLALVLRCLVLVLVGGSDGCWGVMTFRLSGFFEVPVRFFDKGRALALEERLETRCFFFLGGWTEMLSSSSSSLLEEDGGSNDKGATFSVSFGFGFPLFGRVVEVRLLRLGFFSSFGSS